MNHACSNHEQGGRYCVYFQWEKCDTISVIKLAEKNHLPNEEYMTFHSPFLDTDSETRNFSEKIVTESWKHILECQVKTSRSRLGGVLFEHIDLLAERERIEPKRILVLALESVSKISYDRDTSEVCREIIVKYSFCGVLN